MSDALLSPFPEAGHEHAVCVRTAVARAEERCRARGQRLTDMRRRVLEMVLGGHGPVKAYDLLAQLREDNPRAAPPTVYRALDFLLAEGFIHRIASQNAYVGCGEPGRLHGGQFLICRSCGTAAEMDDPELNAVLGRRAAQYGFSIERGTIEMEGVCASCRGRP